MCWSEKSDTEVPKSHAASKFSAETSQSQATIVVLEEGRNDFLLTSQLKNGVVMNTCTRYLDGQPTPIPYTLPIKLNRYPTELVHADLVQRNTHQLDKVIVPQGSLLGSTQIVEMIMKPLLQDNSFRPFHIHVTATLTMLKDGLLSNIREVEVYLITRSYVSSFL